MNLDKSIKRLIWRFQECDTIFVNNNDLKAINTVVDYINESQTKKLDNNLHFGKLYVFTIGSLLNKYDTNIDNELVHIQLNKILATPFNHLAEDIASQMNLRLQCRLIEAAGYKTDIHPAALTSNEKKLVVNNLKKLIPMGDNRSILFGNAWSANEVILGLTTQINNYLNGI